MIGGHRKSSHAQPDRRGHDNEFEFGYHIRSNLFANGNRYQIGEDRATPKMAPLAHIRFANGPNDAEWLAASGRKGAPAVGFEPTTNRL